MTKYFLGISPGLPHAKPAEAAESSGSLAGSRGPHRPFRQRASPRATTPLAPAGAPGYSPRTGSSQRSAISGQRSAIRDRFVLRSALVLRSPACASPRRAEHGWPKARNNWPGQPGLEHRGPVGADLFRANVQRLGTGAEDEARSKTDTSNDKASMVGGQRNSRWCGAGVPSYLLVPRGIGGT